VHFLHELPFGSLAHSPPQESSDMNDWAEFRHFRYLLEIVRQKGFRAAAENLHTVQPNLSTQARHFQETSGVQLYRRLSGGRIEITETGQAFEVIAQDVLDARDDAIAALIAIDHGEVQSLRLGCGPCVDQKLFHITCEAHREMVRNCQILPVQSDSMRLVQEVIAGDIDAALVTSPIKDDRLHVEEIWSDRLVVCLRADHPLAEHSSLQADNLNGNLSILIDPQRHPAAHAVLLNYLEEAGVHLDKYSRASHPVEMQTLVKEGFGFALICEGGTVDQELTTRPVTGTEWILGTAFIYRKNDYPKTIPALLRHLKSRLAAEAEARHLPFMMNAAAKRHSTEKRQHHSHTTSHDDGPEQLSLLN
jgi:DNA-binding transcriptional LysR family regulator